MDYGARIGLGAPTGVHHLGESRNAAPGPPPMSPTRTVGCSITPKACAGS